MSVLATIRNTLTARKQDAEQKAADYWQIVRAIADGEDPGYEAIEAVLSGGDALPAPVCPRSPTHARIRKTGVGERGRNRFVCDDCGSEWQQDADIRSAVPGVKSLADLEADVQLVHQRRQWAEQIAGRDDRQQRLREINAESEKLGEELRSVRERVMAETERLWNERQSLEQAEQASRTAENRLQETCPYEAITDREKKLREEIGKKRLRLHELKRDLYGAGQPGTFNLTEWGSTGSKVLEFQRSIDKLSPTNPNDRMKRQELELRQRGFWEREVKPRQDEMNRLASEMAELEPEAEELARQKLIP